ncbi:hypothetical protein PGB90_004399 [Kerria lacca]
MKKKKNNCPKNTSRIINLHSYFLFFFNKRAATVHVLLPLRSLFDCPAPS